MKNFGLVPIRNFGVLDYESGIFRSAQPQYAYEYKWLKDVLGIKTIVNLRGELKHDDRFSEGLGIKVINIDIPDHHPPTVEQAEEFIKLVQSGLPFPMLFHCEHGHGRTSTFSVLTKLALGWTLKDALHHEKEEFKYHFRHPKQKHFLKKNYG